MRGGGLFYFSNLTPAIMATHAITQICLILFGLFVIIDFFQKKNFKRLLIEITVAIVLLAVIYLTGRNDGLIPFGEESAPNPLPMIFLLLFFVVIGMIANYFFHLQAPFSWLTFIKPIFISPIVLLPIIGAIDYENLGPIQQVSLAFLAFQNGFFWKEIYNKVQASQN